MADNGEYAQSIREVAAKLGKSRPQLYNYKNRGAPWPRKTKKGYRVDKLREWMRLHIGKPRGTGKKKPIPFNAETLAKLEFSIRYWERRYKRARARVTELEKLRVEGTFIERVEYEKLGMELVRLFNRAMDDLTRSMPELPKKFRDLLEERLYDVRNRLADEIDTDNR